MALDSQPVEPPTVVVDVADPPPGAERAHAERTRLDPAWVLLDATNAFLACDDLPSVGRAVATAVAAMFDPDKIAVTIVEPDGSVILADTIGYSVEEVVRIRRSVASRTGFVQRVLAGEAMWSDDPRRTDLRARIAEFGAVSGFTIAIAGPAGVVGTCSATYLAERTFDEPFRHAVAGLAAQAGLTAWLIASRDDVRRAAAESMRRQRMTSAMLKVAGDLAPVTDPGAIPGILVDAIRAATSSRTASVGRRLADGSGFRIVGSSGLSPAQTARFVDTDLPGEGSLARVLAGEPAVSRPGSSATHRESGLGLAVVAPVICDDEIWGFIGLTDPDVDAVEGDLLDLVSGFATIAATAIARADAVSEIDRQRRRSDTLLELSSLLAEAPDGSQIASLVCAFVRRASEAPFAMVARRIPGGERFRITATDGLSGGQVGRITAALDRVDRPSLRDLLGGTTTSRSGEDAVGAGLGIGQAMAAPIVVDGRTEGFIAIGAPAGRPVRTADWQELLVAFGSLTATAIGRADAVAAVGAQRDLLASQVDARTRSLRTALDELVVASEAKTDFLANVSHELRTPLTAILGFIEVLATGLDGPLNEAQRRDVATIQTSSRHLLELIDDLIDIASIEAGRVSLNRAPMSPIGIVEDALATIRPLADAREIDIALVSPGSGVTGILVAVDRGRIREILLNLLSNAVKFTPSGGHVTVEVLARSAAPGCPSDGVEDPPGGIGSEPDVVISVADTGPGIDPADHERVFEKFTRIGDPTIPGTGLGLAISRELARLHGGDVTVESRAGSGSRFIVTLPGVARS